MEKAFPDNYSAPVLKVLDAMTIGTLTIIGSSASRKQQYSSDYDANDKVDVLRLEDVVPKLKKVVSELSLPETYILDIKCGHIDCWEIVKGAVENGKVVGFNLEASLWLTDTLLRSKRITATEASETKRLLHSATDVPNFLHAKANIKFHILRWTKKSILAGKLKYRGITITLLDALKTQGLTKIDVVSNISDRFTEFNVVYDIFVCGKRFSPLKPFIEGVENDILYYSEFNPFKALKRMYSLAVYHKETELVSELLPILNGDLGRLNLIISDLLVLLDLLETAPLSKTATEDVKSQIDGMRARLGTIYSLKDLLKSETAIIGAIEESIKKPSLLPKVIETLETILDGATEKATDKLKL